MTTVIDVLKSMRKHAEEANRNTNTTSSGAAESSSSPPPPRNDNDLSAVTLDTALTPLCHDAYLQRRILPLGPLDQIQVRKNTPRIFCFPMPDQRQSTVSAATIALRLAVQKTLARWPWLGGTVVPVGYDGWERAAMREEQDKKMLEIRYTVPPLDAVMVEGGGCGVFSAKVWSGFTSYARLAARGMPPKVLDCRQLTMREEGVVVNTGLAALRVQANFIPGGLLLAVMDAHPAVDGVGGELVVEELARCLRPGAETMAAEEGRRIGAAAGVRDDNNYMVSNNARGRQGANAAASLQSTPTVPEFELPDPEPPVTSRDDSISAGNPSARILTIRAATITSLKAAVMAELQATAAPGAFVSTHDVLSALIWTATMRARAPRLLLHQHKSEQDEDDDKEPLLSRFCTPVDARNKPAASSSSPPLIAPTYPGNAVVFAFATMPMTELLLLGDADTNANGATETTTITLTRTTTTTTTTIGSQIDSTTSRTRVAKASTTTSVTALARAALAIRRAISAVDGGFVQRRVEAWSGLEDPRQLLATLGAKMDLKESGVFVTSWVGFGADVEWRIPGVQSAAGGRMKAEWVRKPWCEGEGGGVNVMPRRGGHEGWGGGLGVAG